MSTVRRIPLLSLAPLLLAAGAAAAASPADRLADCVDLGAGHQAFRYGNQALLVADGDAHYKLAFGVSGCDALMASAGYTISTDGQPNRLCPSGTQVVTRASACAVRDVMRIAPEDYARYQRKARAR